MDLIDKIPAGYVTSLLTIAGEITPGASRGAGNVHKSISRSLPQRVRSHH
jgi:alkylated DNA nucleotide flippase Atl1